MNIILTVLCSIYGTYCFSFLGTLCYTIYKEKEEERRQRNNEEQYSTVIEVNGFVDSDEES
jgi:hypothetical protein